MTPKYIYNYDVELTFLTAYYDVEITYRRELTYRKANYDVELKYRTELTYRTAIYDVRIGVFSAQISHSFGAPSNRIYYQTNHGK